MGNFYVNFSVKDVEPAKLAELFTKRGDTGFVGPEADGWTTVSTLNLELQDTAFNLECGNSVSATFETTVVGVLNHDDDVLLVDLFDEGTHDGQIVSNPGFFDGRDLDPLIRHSDQFNRVFGNTSIIKILDALNAEHVFAIELHREIAKALSLPSYSVGFGAAYAQRGEFAPMGDGLTAFP